MRGNLKEAVGKSTVSVNLGVGLVREGQKVLLVDADPQGSMTASLGFMEPDDIGRTLATVMEELMEYAQIDPFDGILHHEEGVDLMPANIELAALDVALVNAISRETIMRSYLDEVRDSYDWIIIDCMPSLGMLTINALAAADEVIIPCSVAYLPVKGLEQLVSTIVTVQKRLNKDLKIRGIMMTMVDFRTNYANDVAEMIRGGYGERIGVFNTVIPHSVRVAETSAVGVSIYEHCPSGKAAAAFEELTGEVMCNG